MKQLNILKLSALLTILLSLLIVSHTYASDSYSYPERGMLTTTTTSCETPQALDLYYILDLSSSMGQLYPGAGNKLQAVKQAISQTNSLISSWNNGSQFGLITFYGGQIGVGDPPTYPVVTRNELAFRPFWGGLTTSEATFNNKLNPLTANGSTPTYDALDFSEGEMLADNNGGPKPVFILLSDGVPTISSERYSFADADVQAVSLRNGEDNWRDIEQVRVDGMEGPTGYYSGEPLADVMQEINDIMSANPDFTYHSIAIQGEGNNIFNSDILEYVAFVGNGFFAEPDNLTDLQASLQAAIFNSACEDETTPTPTSTPETSTPTPTSTPPTTTTTPTPTSCETPQALDLYYILDLSSSMGQLYPGAGNKLQAAKQAISQANSLISSWNNGSQFGLITFYGGQIGVGDPPVYEVVTTNQLAFRPFFGGLTTSLSSFNNKLNALSANGSTPLASALAFSEGEMEADNNGTRQPVFVVLSDGVPTISLDQLAFDETLLNQIPISDGQGGWRSPDDVRADGGEPLADVMEVMDAIMAAHPDWIYHAVAIQSEAPYNDEIMQYIATVGNGLFAAPNNFNDLEASLQVAIENSGCPSEITPTPTNTPMPTVTGTPPTSTPTPTSTPPTPTPTSTPPGPGFNGDYWAIFASDTMQCGASEAETSGPSTFVEVDPVFQPPSGFAFANVHSNGSFTVGNHSPIMGQVTYQDLCHNCLNALILPEQESHELVLPDFDAYRALAESEALANGQHLTGDIVWGEPISDEPPQIISDGIWYISGTLTIESDTWALTQNAFVYVSGEVNIDGFFYAQNLSIISDGKINISGTLQNYSPFGSTHPNPLFQDNVAVLWSNHDLSEAGTECTQPVIKIDTTIVNSLPPTYLSNNDIRGAILAPHGRIHFEVNQMNSTARGTLIGDTVFVSSNPDTAAQARVQYNGSYFPPQPANMVVLALEPPTVTTGVGEPFTLTIEVQAGTQLVDGAAAYLNFDPTHLEVVSITPGDELPLDLENQFDNSSGQIDFAAGTVSDYPSGTFTLATVSFTAISETTGTSIDFNAILPRKSDVTFDGSSILSESSGSTVIVENASLVCAVTLQGRPAAPNPRWSVPLTVSLTTLGNDTPTYQFTPISDENGIFTITGITPGSYELRVKHSHTLQNMLLVALQAGSNNYDCGTLLEGDADDDNFVTITDFSILATAFGKCQGTLGYDQRADFNEDDCISILDFSLLASNFGQGGDMAPVREAVHAPTGEVSLIIDQPVLELTEIGQTFLVTVQVEADIPVDGAAALIDFSQELLNVKAITAGSSFPLVLQNQFDNQNGTIDFAAGTLDMPEHGTITLMQVEFEALAVGQSPLKFQFESPRTTDVTAGGRSVLTSISDGTDETTPTAVRIDDLTTTKGQNSLLWLTLLLIGLLMASIVRWRRVRNKL